MEKDKGKTAYILLRLPAVILAVFWPLLVHAVQVSTHLEGYPWYPDTARTIDYFMYIRSRALLLIAGLMLLALIKYLVLRRRRVPGHCFSDRRTLGIILGFGLFFTGMLISSLISAHHTAVWTGMSEQFESFPVLCGYLITAVYTAVFFRTGKEREFLIRLLLICAAVQCMIGMTQLFGHDFFSTGIGRRLIGAAASAETVSAGGAAASAPEYIFAGTSDHRVYLCFYHPNYAAVYLMLMLPLCMNRMKASIKQAGFCRKLLYGSLLILLLICLAGTGSKTALAVSAFVLLVSAVRYSSLKWKGPKYLGVLLPAAVIIIAAGGFMFTNAGKAAIRRITGDQTHGQLSGVVPGAEGIDLNWKGETLRLTMQQEGEHTWFSVLDGSGRTLQMDFDQKQERFHLIDPTFEELSFDAYTDHGAWWIAMYQGEIPWYFVHEQETDSWQYITLYRKPDTPKDAPHTPTFGYDNALSGRVYIWSRTLPLLGKRLLLGSGADSFALVFPQNDYAAKANVGLDLLMPVISRPHSLYLQTAVQAGLLPALGLFAALFMLILLPGEGTQETLAAGRCQGIVRRFHKMDGEIKALRISMLLWLLMGMTNDSVVVVTPIVCMIAAMCGTKETSL